jgi:hypothetical protein
MDCPICYEILHEKDVLNCNHKVHKFCVKKAIDIYQEELIQQGFPPEKYGKCPICRKIQYDILADLPNFYEKIIINKNCIINILNLLINNNGWISIENIPIEIIQQMNNTKDNDKLLYINTAASIIWMNKNNIPEKIILHQIKNKGFKQKLIY